MISVSFRLFGLTILISAFGSVLPAQVKLPKPPDNYDVEFRYRIQAGRNERIVQFAEMTKDLKKLGFKQKETDDSDLDVFDPSAERMSGTIPSSTASDILNEPHIQTVLLVPAEFKPPAADNDRVKVQLELGRGFSLEKQQEFGLQTKQVLAGFGFQEAVAYDHHGYTMLRGTMPWPKIHNLLKDLRGQPAGWFLPLTPENEVPELFRSKLPIRQITVFPEDEAPAPVAGQPPLAPPPAEQPQAVKLSADLRRQIEQAKGAGPARVEMIVNFKPNPNDNSWRDDIRSTNGATVIEGLLDNLITVTVPESNQVYALARLPFVTSIRLPRTASVPLLHPAAIEPKQNDNKEEPKEKAQRDAFVPAQALANLDLLKETRLDGLHAKGGVGTGVRVAIIDSDFGGWEKFVDKGLPKSTLYIDMTAERNRQIQPEPGTSAPGEIGHGVHCALAVRYAAPDAGIALIRVAPDAPHEVVNAFRYMLGEYFQPESFRARREQLDFDAATVRVERDAAHAEYRQAFDDFDDDEPARARRRRAKAAIAAVEAKERELTARSNRLLKLEGDLASLKGVRVILNTVGWNAGQSLDATSALSRFLDQKMSVARPSVIINEGRQPQPALWFQPAGDTRGQTWLGLFQDADGNGVMEFAPPDMPLKPGRWSRELNFLALRTGRQADDVELPAGARVRISIQWREPHDPGIDEAEYRQPIAPLNLMLLRQRDPNGEKVPSDEMEVIARSEGNPDRLLAEPDFGVYEQTIDVELPATGRYALRVDGRQPIGIRPGGSLGIREQEIRWELKPRIFLDVIDALTRAKGRLVFGDYESFLGGVAVPADARSVVAVGAMHASKRPQAYSAIGAGPVSELYIKPNVMTYDRLPASAVSGEAKGSALSAALAAGMGACLLSAGAESANFLQYLRVPPGSVFEVPDSWIKR